MYSDYQIGKRTYYCEYIYKSLHLLIKEFRAIGLVEK